MTRRSLGFVRDSKGGHREVHVHGDALDLSGIGQLTPAGVAELERVVGAYWQRLAESRAAALVQVRDPRVPEVRAELAGFLAAGRPVTLEGCDWADITGRLARLDGYGNSTLRQFAAEVYGPAGSRARGLWAARASRRAFTSRRRTAGTPAATGTSPCANAGSVRGATVAGDAAGGSRECGKPSRFIVARTDADQSYGAGEGTEQACEEHLAAAVIATMVNGGEDDADAIVTVIPPGPPACTVNADDAGGRSRENGKRPRFTLQRWRDHDTGHYRLEGGVEEACEEHLAAAVPAMAAGADVSVVVTVLTVRLYGPGDAREEDLGCMICPR
jgi:hypothetical protein